MTPKKTVGRPRITKEQQQAFRADVARVARTLFFEEGFDSVSMRRIAGEVGCHPMSLYKYFDNKHAILRDIWSVIFEELHAVCVAATAQEATPLGKVQAVTHTFMTFWLERPEYFRVVYMVTDPQTLDLGKDVYVPGSPVANILQLVKAVLADCITARGTQTPDCETCLQLFYAGMVGAILCMLTIPEYPWMSQADFIEQTTANLCRGAGFTA